MDLANVATSPPRTDRRRPARRFLSPRAVLVAALFVGTSGLPAPWAPAVRAADSGPAGGGGGSSSAPPPIAENRRIQRDVGGDQLLGRRGDRPAVAIAGKVVNGSGTPLRNVVVKLFSAGILVSSAKTTPDGTFTIEGNPMEDVNATTILWVESPNPETLLDGSIVLQAGQVATERGLFSPCCEVVKTMGGAAGVEVTLLTQEERRKAIAKRECFK